jgi:hypothetical protein
MSGISSVSSYGSNPYQWLQQLNSLSSTQSTDSSTASTATSDSQLVYTIDVSGVDSDQFDTLKDQIKTAITSALQDAEKSGDTADFRKLIKDAIEKTLKDNGIDTNSLKETAQDSVSGIGAMPPLPPPIENASLSAGDSSTNGNDPLASALESMGITGDDLTNLLDQINTAVNSAVQNVQNTGNSTDFKDAIVNAIDGTLKANGIDPEKVKTQMQSSSHKHVGMPPPPPGGMPPIGDDSSSSDDDSSTSSSTSTTSTDNSSTSSSDQIDQIIKLLEDLLSKLQSTNNSTDKLSGFLFDQQS